MNAADRKELGRAVTMLAEAREIISGLADAEQEKFDNMSEGLQASERGETIQAAAETLQTAVDGIENVESDLAELEG